MHSYKLSKEHTAALAAAEAAGRLWQALLQSSVHTAGPAPIDMFQDINA